MPAKSSKGKTRLAGEDGHSYDAKDLKGLRVSHAKDAFDDGEQHVLTLKDAGVLDEDDDVLENVNMAEDERTNTRLDTLKRGKDAYKYTGYDDQELQDGKRGVLSKYDEEIDGQKAGESFVISEDTTAMDTDVAPRPVKAESNNRAREVKRDMLNLDYLKDYDTSDYKEEAPVKLKKKKKVQANRKVTRDDDEDAEMTPQRVEYEDNGFADDDDIQISLARQRRKMIKERKNREDSTNNHHINGDSTSINDTVPIKTEDVADQDAEDAEQDGSGRIVINDTEEFVRGISLQKIEDRLPHKSTSGTTSSDIPIKKEEEVEENSIAKRRSPTPVGEAETDQRLKEEGTEDEEMKREGTEDVEMKREGTEDVEMKTEQVKNEDTETSVAPSSRGLASTLSALRQQGMLKPKDEETLKNEQLSREEAEWKAQWHKEEMMRDEERVEARRAMANMTDEQRRAENQRRNSEYARRDMERFRNYKPNVEIKYHDEFGRDLTAKEAWKDLSHRFHGKESGAGKTDKRLKKIEEERKRDRMASGDTPLSTNAAFQARQEQLGSATMVLSVGNKGAAPQQEEEYLNNVQTGQLQKRKGKTKKGTDSSQKGSNLTPTLGGTQTSSAAEIPSASSSKGQTQAGGFESFVPRGFAPIRSAARSQVPDQTGSRSGTSTPAEGSSSIKIGLASQGKRKATEDPEGSPPVKK